MSNNTLVKGGKWVEVYWYDAYNSADWFEHKEVLEQCSSLMLCHTIGWLLDEGMDYVIICHTITDKPLQMVGVMNIPKRSIKEIIRDGG